MIHINYLKNQSLQNKVIKKQKNRRFLRFFITLFCTLYFSIGLVTVNSYSVYASSLGAAVDIGGGFAALGATGACGALVSAEALIPMILVALGVAGIGYVAGKNNIIEEIVEDLKEQGGDFIHQVKDSRGVLRDYISTRYIDGKNYVEKNIIEKIAEKAIDMGLFDGVNIINNIYAGNINNIELGLYTGTAQSINYCFNFGYQLDYSDYDLGANYPKYLLELENHLNDIGVNMNLYTGWIQVNVTGSSLDAYLILKSDFQNIVITNKNNNNGYIEFNALQGVNVYKHTFVSNTWRYVTTTYRNLFVGSKIQAGVLSISAIGMDVIDDVKGIPVTNDIPIEAAGELTLPNWLGLVINNLFPVSLPSGYNVPIIFDPSISIPLDISITVPWVNPFPYPLPDDPAVPDYPAQGKAQEGTTDSIPTTPSPSNPEGTFEGMLVPAEIRSKYPFSLAYDFYDCWSILWYGVDPNSAQIGFTEVRNTKSIKNIGDNKAGLLRLTPVFEWKPPVSINGFTNMEPVVVDLSSFNPIASIFRGIFLIVWTTNMWLAGYKIMTGNQ